MKCVTKMSEAEASQRLTKVMTEPLMLQMLQMQI
ncbi:hypothetical protein CPS_2493 [Colwellia psychrerythraea 34H]|uniref:Uncharacterized protein n=1 Tax=Colwellia psychrerythraea (strain 34H / ATCC BAA-681) TaxID=167879 RepID=Q481R0_COLP3|nr:hypothetical protein CPS_2493 [Colwellia psychrerythraea 34H]